MRTIARMLVAAALVVLTAGATNGQDGWKGTAGLIHLQDAGTVGKGKLIFSLGTSYYKSSEILTKGLRSRLNYTDFDEAEVDYHFFNSRAALTLGVSDYFEFSAALHVKNWIMQVGDDYKVEDVFETTTRGGLGDTDLLIKISPPAPTKYLRLGVLGAASFPTGRDEACFTTGKTDFTVKGLATVNLTEVKSFVPTKLHLNVGYTFNRNEDEGYGILYANNPDSSGFYAPAYPKSPEGKSSSFNDVFTLGTGLEFLMHYSRLFVEFQWESFISAEFSEADTATYYLAGNKNIYTITPGISLMSKDGASLTFGVDFNLNSDGNPSFLHLPERVYYLMLSFGGNVLPQDQDKDGTRRVRRWRRVSNRYRSGRRSQRTRSMPRYAERMCGQRNGMLQRRRRRRHLRRRGYMPRHSEGVHGGFEGLSHRYRRRRHSRRHRPVPRHSEGVHGGFEGLPAR
jgi:hypothetical protein